MSKYSLKSNLSRINNIVPTLVLESASRGSTSAIKGYMYELWQILKVATTGVLIKDLNGTTYARADVQNQLTSYSNRITVDRRWKADAEYQIELVLAQVNKPVGVSLKTVVWSGRTPQLVTFQEDIELKYSDNSSVYYSAKAGSSNPTKLSPGVTEIFSSIFPSGESAAGIARRALDASIDVSQTPWKEMLASYNGFKGEAYMKISDIPRVSNSDETSYKAWRVNNPGNTYFDFSALRDAASQMNSLISDTLGQKLKDMSDSMSIDEVMKMITYFISKYYPGPSKIANLSGAINAVSARAIHNEIGGKEYYVVKGNQAVNMTAGDGAIHEKLINFIENLADDFDGTVGSIMISSNLENSVVSIWSDDINLFNISLKVTGSLSGKTSTPGGVVTIPKSNRLANGVTKRKPGVQSTDIDKVVKIIKQEVEKKVVEVKSNLMASISEIAGRATTRPGTLAVHWAKNGNSSFKGFMEVFGDASWYKDTPDTLVAQEMIYLLLGLEVPQPFVPFTEKQKKAVKKIHVGKSINLEVLRNHPMVRWWCSEVLYRPKIVNQKTSRRDFNNWLRITVDSTRVIEKFTDASKNGKIKKLKNSLLSENAYSIKKYLL